MYLFLPYLFQLAIRPSRAAITWIAARWLASAALVLVLFRAGLNYHLIKYFPCFLSGVLAFTLRHRRKVLPGWVLPLAIGLFAAVLPPLVARGVRENLAIWPVCLATGLLIPHCREIQATWLRRAGKYVARYSYGIYLVHVPCIDLAFVTLRGAAPALQWLAFLISVPSLSVAAFFLIETPGINLGRRLVTRLAGPREPAKQALRDRSPAP